MKQELLASITEIADEEDYSSLKKEVKNAKERKKGYIFKKKYGEFLKGENRNIIKIVGKVLKKFKESYEFFSQDMLT